MKKVFTTAREMAHNWANGDMKTYGYKGGRASADYNRFYSYATVIGVVDKDGTLLMTSSRYSNTTRKHQAYLWDAFKYGKKLSFESQIHDYYGLSEMDIILLCDEEKRIRISTINRLIGSQSRARTADYTSDIFRHYEELKEIFDHFKRDLDYELPNISEMVEKAKEKVKVEKAEIKQLNMNAIQDDFVKLWRDGLQYGKAIEQITVNMTNTQIRHIKQNLQWGFQSDKSDYIRISNGRIETNRGASVTFEEAKLLLKCIESSADCKGLKVGQFTVIEKTSDFIKIGCHKFNIEENIGVLRCI